MSKTADRADQKFKTDSESLKNQVTIEAYRSRGPGGQRKNKRETSVRLRHLPTGMTVVATEHRHQSQNLKLAFQRLGERLQRLRQRKKRRIPTHVPLRAVEKKKEGKVRRSMRKQLRQKIDEGRLNEE